MKKQPATQAVPVTIINALIAAVREATQSAAMIVEARISTGPNMTILKIGARPERGQVQLDIEVDLSFRPEVARVWAKRKPLDFLAVDLTGDQSALSETIRGYYES